MKLNFLKLSPDEHRLYIEQASIQKNIPPVIMEKDFWVCWLLNILFKSEFADSLVFKGGTSMSKVFGAIDRFSEDIDLSLSPTFLRLPETEAATRTQGAKWMKSAEAVCEVVVKQEIMQKLEALVFAVLGKNERARFEFLKDPNSNSPVLLFHYPSSQPTGFDYVKRSVKIDRLINQCQIGIHAITLTQRCSQNTLRQSKL